MSFLKSENMAREWKKQVTVLKTPEKGTKGNLASSHSQPRRTIIAMPQTKHAMSVSSSLSTNTGFSRHSISSKFRRHCSNHPIRMWIVIFCTFYIVTWLLTFLIFPMNNDNNGDSHWALERWVNSKSQHSSIVDPIPIIDQSQSSNGDVVKPLNIITDINSNNNNNNPNPNAKANAVERQLSNGKMRPIFDSLKYNIGKKRIEDPNFAGRIIAGQNVAISVLITKDPGISGGFLDSAGALVVSIMEAQSVHNITLIALIHTNVTKCVPILKAMGYQIRVYDTPFQISEVRNKRVAEEMKTDGCCGIVESLKLWVWTWTEFDAILQIDADIHFHKNFDELFLLNTTLGWTHGATAHLNQELMNGGYLIVRPKPKHFTDMVAVLREGDFSGRGWKKSGIGWVYGGRTIQGILPYYYFKVAVGDETEIARCKYNNMVEIDKCRAWQYENVTSNHFTWCQKPWYCVSKQGYELCDAFRERWWQRSRVLETLLEFGKGREECPQSRKYTAIDYTKSPFIKRYMKEHNLKLS